MLKYIKIPEKRKRCNIIYPLHAIYYLLTPKVSSMSENIIIVLIGISTLLGATGLAALLWGVKTGQFDDKSKFIDAARFDNEEELRDAVMMEEKQKARKQKQQNKKKHYMPAD